MEKKIKCRPEGQACTITHTKGTYELHSQNRGQWAPYLCASLLFCSKTASISPKGAYITQGPTLDHLALVAGGAHLHRSH